MLWWCVALLVSIQTHISHAVNLQLEEAIHHLPPDLQDEVDLTVPEIIQKYQYPVEVHEVVTDDGYILQVHRIPHGKNIAVSNKGVVLVMHGILESSSGWIICGPKNGLGYILADEGYDVWLGNARGNRYSKNHTSIDPKSKKFWNFSFHEMAIYDTPAIVDYIIEQTGESKIFHVAHSQGTTSFYIMCSERPEYNEKIRSHISLSPVGYMEHVKSPLIRFLSKAEFIGERVFDLIGQTEFLPKDGIISKLGENLCGVNPVTKLLCTNVLFVICGFDYKQMNETILPLILAHVPAGSSSKQFLHFGQEINSGKFSNYDYGWVRNMKTYGSFKPESYDLSKVSVPIYFFYSKHDWVSSDKDVERLAEQLPSLRGKFMVDKKFNHLDYLYAIHAPEVIYSKVISLLRMHYH